MIHFIQADFLLLWFLIPIFFLVYALVRRNRKKRIQRFGDTLLVERLMPDAPRYKGWVRLCFFSLAWFFFVLGLSRPVMGARLKEHEAKGVEVMVVLDVSNSMLAQDYSPNRLERAKLAISKLVDRLKDDRIGLIIFAGQSFVQLPITTDYVSAKIFLNTIATESVPVQGTALGDAITTAIKSFSMDSENSRAIILITDGENHEDDPVEAARAATEMGIRVYCVGVGSPEGKPIPVKDGGLLRDKNGNVVVTRLDEAILHQVAEAGNGIYVRAGNSEFGLNPIIDDIRSLDAKQYQSLVFEDFDEQYMYFFGIAIFFLLVEMSLGNRRNRRSLFGGVGKSPLVVLLFLLLSSTVYGQQDRSEVRKGNKNFKKENYAEAELAYRRGLLKDSLSKVSHYNLGSTLVLLDRAQEAEHYYREIVDSIGLTDPQQIAQFQHNLGNACLAQKKYAEAVAAYKESLRKNPTDMDTKTNLAYAQKMLENQQQQQDQSQDQQDQQDQQQDQQDQQDQQQQPKDSKQDQNKDQQQQQSNPAQQPQISPQAAQQILQALEDQEKETQDKVKKEKAKKLKEKKRDKNW